VPNLGKVIQIIGPIIDIKFDSENLPDLFNALEINAGDKKVIAEVEQHIGDDTVRAIAMESTEGLRRGMEVLDTGSSVSVPVGKEVLGRLFNVLGNPIDEEGEFTSQQSYPIHRSAPSFEEQSVEPEIFETGIKVIDLLAPYQKGGKRSRSRENCINTRVDK